MALFNAEPTPLRSKIITFIKFIFFLGLGILVIWLSLKNLSQEEKTQILKSFRTANYNWVIAAIILGIFSHILRALRWKLFFEPMGYHPKIKNMFFAVMIGYFANLAFPRLGEVTRCGILAKYEKIPFNKSFGTVITERALDLLIFVGLFFLMLFSQIGTIHGYLDKNIYPKLQGKISGSFSYNLFYLGIIGFLFLLVVLFFLFRKKITHSKFYLKGKTIFLGFWEGLKSLGQIRNPVLFVFYSLAIWVLYFFMLYFIFFCFAETSSLSLGAGLSALVLGSVGIMITPGGIGLYPAIVQETLLLYGVLNTTGLALGWIAWTAQTIMILIVGGISLLLLSFSKAENEKP
jgi:glycosyltransferase 2 family protein